MRLIFLSSIVSPSTIRQDFANRYNLFFPSTSSCDRGAHTLSHTSQVNSNNTRNKRRTDIRISIFEYALSTENNEIENKNPKEVKKNEK